MCATDLPTRHGADLQRARRTAAPVKRFLKGPSEPDTATWKAIGASLTVGDAPMDALLEWMFEVGLGKSMRLYEQALHQALPPSPTHPRH
ncbi:hypothetical protein [Pseudomonas nitroreducens]|uniref:hypothetical protein n=1 Tax=Pseudomonas nitroreducens TaxID=46680 RepID=UPI0004B11452